MADRKCRNSIRLSRSLKSVKCRLRQAARAELANSEIMELLFLLGHLARRDDLPLKEGSTLDVEMVDATSGLLRH